MPSQRPSVPFLSSFLAAFRQQSAAPSLSSQQAKQHSSQPSASASSYSTGGPTAPRAISTAAAAASAASASRSAAAGGGGVVNQLPLHSPRGNGVPIPGAGRRRGSDSSSEGFRDVLGADKWYIGGRTAGGEEKFFPLGVVRRIRSTDRLSLDRLSL